VPAEVVRYFKFREKVLTQYADTCATLPEPALAGHFIGGDHNNPPALESAAYLHRLIQDDDEWDISILLHGLYNNLSHPAKSRDYYDILLEFAKLPRSAWRIVKERMRLCIEKAQNDEFALPYRMTWPETGCGFVFIPVQSELVRRPDWQSIRVRAVQQLTAAHKYDQRLSKCVGYLVGKDGEYFDIDWCLISHEWVKDPGLERALAENFPFRPVREAAVHGYSFAEDNAQ
jgi:hypothetical protein